MKNTNEIINDVKKTFLTDWECRKGLKIPDTDDLQMGNDAVKFEGAVLYADMRKSTEWVLNYRDFFVAKIYKVFLRSICEVIKNNQGEITSFDGDRVMAVFIGNSKCSSAAKSGLQIYSIVREINKQIKNIYPSANCEIDYAVGIDVSELFVVKTGIRKSNDLAWIGNAANVAAKLSEMNHLYEKTFITKRVYDRLKLDCKYDRNKKDMWSKTGFTSYGEIIYASAYFWPF